MDMPHYWGMNYTSTIHSTPEGPTDPKNNTLPTDYTVVITGAGKGLGYHNSLSYASAGATNIAISSRTLSDLEKLQSETKQVNPKANVLVQTCDTTKELEVKSLASATKSAFSRLDCVIANAGVISKFITKPDGRPKMPIGIYEDEDFSRVIQINILGSYFTAQHFVPQLEATKDGPQTFVVITSVTALTDSSDLTPVAYNLSNIAMNRMVHRIANDHGKNGVQAYAVHPGAVVTPASALNHTTQLGDVWKSSKSLTLLSLW